MSDHLGGIPENFCPLPFIQLELQPTGDVSPCCWNQALVLGNVKDQRLDEIWNGESMRALRREFLNGAPRACDEQIRHIGCNKYFERLKKNVEFAEIQKGPPRKLDVRLNGKCNLECVMCEVWKQPNGLYEASGFWEKGPTEIFPHLLELDVLGGEPFVQKDTYRLIDEVSKVNQNCTWAFVTNGQWKFTEAIRSRLDKIRIRTIQVSLDSLEPETYAKIRKKGELAKSLDTIRQLNLYRNQRIFLGGAPARFRLQISSCVQKDNWEELPRFIEFAKANRLELILQHIYSPREMSLAGLEEPKKRKALDSLESLFNATREASLLHIIMPLRDALAK